MAVIGQAKVSAALLLGCVGCYPDPLTTSETDLVVTVRDLERNYSELKSYALADEVFDLCDVLADVEPGAGGAGGAPDDDPALGCRDVNHNLDASILRAIQSNMAELGFVEVERDADPDVVVLPGIAAQENWEIYYPYCDYYYYPYCFYYPWAPVAVSYPVGTLVMYMVAPGELDAPMRAMAVTWVGVVRAGLGSSTSADLNRLTADIDQAFRQSQYLGEGKVAP